MTSWSIADGYTFAARTVIMSSLIADPDWPAHALEIETSATEWWLQASF
ncbi:MULTISPECIES: hypothetical protein [Rhodococcus]|nr:hypothetical protein [Rhodococcus sp. ACS1]